jgi:hypothetical protein
MHLGVAITIAALCLWQPQPRPPRAASRGRAAAPLLCTDASSDWRRRDVLRAAAVSALTAGGLSAGPAFAAAPPAETVPQIDALVWRPAAAGTGGATPGCSAASAGTAFGPKFVNYLARFLLSYDIPSRRLWRARAAEIPLAWNKKQVGRGASCQPPPTYLATTLLTHRRAQTPLCTPSPQVADARFQHLGEFAGAVEAALCAYTPESGKWSDPLIPQEAARVRQLRTLLLTLALALALALALVLTLALALAEPSPLCPQPQPRRQP